MITCVTTESSWSGNFVTQVLLKDPITAKPIIKKNLIYKHIDYWDSGANVYSNLPIIGSIFKKIHNG